LITETFGDREGFVPLWMFEGPPGEAVEWTEAYGFEAEVLLVDEDKSVEREYFHGQLEGESDAFARYPRHFVIDAEGRFTYVSTVSSPDALIAAIEAALGEE